MKYLIRIMLILSSSIVISGLAGCGREENIETGTEESSDHHDPDSYPGTMAVEEENEGAGKNVLGIMHAIVLDVDEGEKDSYTVYSVKDIRDPDNAWSFSALEAGMIEAEMTAGAPVSLLFYGDIAGDGEDMSFIAAVPDKDYVIKRVSGKTVSNTMSSFAVRTAEGTEFTFTKDNCFIESGALDDSGDTVVVYYADGKDILYPMRVYGDKHDKK